MPVPGIAVSPGPAHPLLPGGCLKPEIRCGCRLGDVVSRVPLWRKLRAQCVIGCVHPRQAQGPSQPECPPRGEDPRGTVAPRCSASPFQTTQHKRKKKKTCTQKDSTRTHAQYTHHFRLWEGRRWAERMPIQMQSGLIACLFPQTKF